MGNLFSKKPEKRKLKDISSTVNSKDRAILDLKNTRDKLKKYRKNVQNETSKARTQVKELLLKKQKERAALVLKLCKLKEAECDKIDGQLLSIFQMINDLEWASHNVQIIEALKTGTSELNRLNQQTPLDKIEILLEETEEAIEMENEISKALTSYSSTAMGPIADEELEEELMKLMGAATKTAAAANTEGVSLPSDKVHEEMASLPDAPTSAIPALQLVKASAAEEEEELRSPTVAM